MYWRTMLRAWMVVTFVFYFLSLAHGYQNKTELLSLYAKYCGHFRLCNPSAVKFPVSTTFVKKIFNQCPECSCERDCDVTGNCCADLQLADNFIDRTKHQTCIDTKLVVSKCLFRRVFKYDKSDKTKCENVSLTTNDPLTLIPVSSPKVKISYRNIYCAKCNNISDVDFWHIQIQCQEIEDLGHLTSISAIWKLNNTCAGSLKYVPTDSKIAKSCKVEKYVGFVYKTCNETGSWKTYDPDVQRACLQTSMPFRFGGVTFKNVFCYHCNWPIPETSTRLVNTNRGPGRTGLKIRRLEQTTSGNGNRGLRPKSGTLSNNIPGKLSFVLHLGDGSSNDTQSDSPNTSINTTPSTTGHSRFIRELPNLNVSPVSVNTTAGGTISFTADTVVDTDMNLRMDSIPRTFNIIPSDVKLEDSLIKFPGETIITANLSTNTDSGTFQLPNFMDREHEFLRNNVPFETTVMPSNVISAGESSLLDEYLPPLPPLPPLATTATRKSSIATTETNYGPLHFNLIVSTTSSDSTNMDQAILMNGQIPHPPISNTVETSTPQIVDEIATAIPSHLKNTSTTHNQNVKHVEPTSVPTTTEDTITRGGANVVAVIPSKLGSSTHKHTTNGFDKGTTQNNNEIKPTLIPTSIESPKSPDNIESTAVPASVVILSGLEPTKRRTNVVVIPDKTSSNRSYMVENTANIQGGISVDPPPTILPEKVESAKRRKGKKSKSKPRGDKTQITTTTESVGEASLLSKNSRLSKRRLVDSCTMKKAQYRGTKDEFKQLRWACENFISLGYPAYRSNGIKQYKNPFCCKCDSKADTCTPSPPPDGLLTETRVHMMSVPKKPGYRFLFDVTSGMTSPGTDDRVDGCEGGMFYDHHKETCRSVVCSPGRVFKSGRCRPLLASGVYLRYTLDTTYVVHGGKADNSENHTDIAANLNDVILSKLSNMFPGIIVTSNFLNITKMVPDCNDGTTSALYKQFIETTDREQHISNAVVFISSRMDIVLQPNTNRQSAEEVLLKLKNETIHYVINGSNFTSTPIIDGVHALKEEFNGNVKVIDEINGDSHSHTPACFTHTVIHNQTFTSVDEFSKLLLIDIHQLLSCPQVELDDTEFIVIDNSHIQVKATSNIIIDTNYLKQDDGMLRICTETYEINEVIIRNAMNYSEVDNAELALRVLNWILTVISLICLAMTFGTYCMHAKLQTLPGKNNMCLVGLLFFAQLFLFVGLEESEDKTNCVIFAILIHYFWLCAFLSMNVCSLHMFRVFTGSLHRFSYTNSERLMYYYICYIFGTPIFILTATIVANLFESEGKSLGYGSKLCFLNGPLNIGIFFVLPVGVMILLNTFYFTTASFKIYSSPHIHRNAKDSRDFFMYMKLFSLTGICWVLQILESQFDVIYVRFLSVIINGSQGVFIFIAFVCNDRVLSLFKHFPVSAKSLSMRSSTLQTASVSSSRSKRSSLDEYKPAVSVAKPPMYEYKPNLSVSLSYSPGIPV